MPRWVPAPSSGKTPRGARSLRGKATGTSPKAPALQSHPGSPSKRTCPLRGGYGGPSATRGTGRGGPGQSTGWGLVPVEAPAHSCRPPPNRVPRPSRSRRRSPAAPPSTRPRGRGRQSPARPAAPHPELPAAVIHNRCGAAPHRSRQPVGQNPCGRTPGGLGPETGGLRLGQPGSGAGSGAVPYRARGPGGSGAGPYRR